METVWKTLRPLLDNGCSVFMREEETDPLWRRVIQGCKQRGLACRFWQHQHFFSQPLSEPRFPRAPPLLLPTSKTLLHHATMNPFLSKLIQKIVHPSTRHGSDAPTNPPPPPPRRDRRQVTPTRRHKSSYLSFTKKAGKPDASK